MALNSMGGLKCWKMKDFFITWKYCLQRLISNNGCLLVNIPEKDKRTSLQSTNDWKLRNLLTNALLHYSWQSGGWGVCLWFFCFDIFFIALTKLFWQTQTPYGKTEVNSWEQFSWLFIRKPHYSKANIEDPNNSFRSCDLPETLDWIQQL